MKMEAFESLMADIADKIITLPANERVEYFKMITSLHGMCTTAFVLTTSEETGTLGEEILEGYLEALNKDIRTCTELSFLANGMKYADDPNKELREELLRE